MKLPASLYTSCALLAFAPLASASTISATDPAAGGITYKNTVTMSGTDSATFQNHCGAWSWEDDSLATTEEPKVGWTHTSNWTALQVTESAYLTVRMTRKAGVPWPSANDQSRVASTASMFPSFTLWKNWDNDLAPQAFADANNGGTAVNDWHIYNNHGNVAWAEDLSYMGHVDNSTSEFVERTFIVLPGNYSIVQGSNAPSNDSTRQGYEVLLTTARYYPPIVGDDSYFTPSHIQPLVIPAASGILSNDANVQTGYTMSISKLPTKGTVTVAANGSFTYTPGAYFGEAGIDSFTYTMTPTNVGDPVGPATVVISTTSSAAGLYTGLLLDEGDGPIEGMIKLSTTSTGAFTGVAWVQGKRHTLTGKLSGLGVATVKAKPELEELELTLSAQADGRRHLFAHVMTQTVHLEGEIEQSPFSRFATAPMAGTHNVTLTPATTGETLPPGNGKGTLSILANGSATLTGKLGDNTPFSVQSALIVGTNSGPTIPLYAPLYTKMLGKVGGLLTFGATAQADATGTLTVVKPPQTSGAFKAGFTLDYNAVTARPVKAVRAKK